MKTEQFKELIRAIVREELQKSLPVLVPKIVAEALNTTAKKPKLIETESHDDFFEQLQKEISGTAVSSQQKPKQQKKFSSNPLLNDILNETEGGVPQDVSYGDLLPKPSFKQNSQKLNIQSATPILNEETKAQAELGVFKDYRQLMKAVDVKKKQGPFGGGSIGGLSIEGGVPNDFSPID